MSINVGSKQPLAAPPTSATPGSAAVQKPAATRSTTADSVDSRAHAGAPVGAALPAIVAGASNHYTVVAGDTLANIGGRFGTTATALEKANGLVEPNKLSVGQRLTVPGRAIATVTAPTTLTALAAQYGAKVDDLAVANGLDAKATLAPGQQLWLSDATLYTVKATDNLAGIAKKFGLTAQALAHANGLEAGKPLKVGQLLVLVPGKVTPGRRDLPDPALMKEHRQSWGYVFDKAGKLYVQGISADDIEQGQAGDCYFLASIAAVANKHPDLIRNAIHPNGDGTYTVTFHQASWVEDKAKGTWSQHFKPVKVTVDGELPGGIDYQLYASEGRSGHELWAPILEKAYARWKGGYEQIGNGGYPADVLGELVGRVPSSIPLVNVKPAKVFQQLAQQQSKGAAMCASSKPDALVAKTGIVGNHAYSVLGVTMQNGKEFVQLRNPWGFKEFGHDGKDDGSFLMPIAQFVKDFTSVDAVA